MKYFFFKAFFKPKSIISKHAIHLSKE